MESPRLDEKLKKIGYDQIVELTMNGAIVPPIQTFEAQGAATERERIRVAVEGLQKNTTLMSRHLRVIEETAYQKILSLLKEADK